MISINDLTITFQTGLGCDRPVINNATLQVGPHESWGIVGESGAGKSLLVKALLGLLPHGAKVEKGVIAYDQIDLTKTPSDFWQTIRGFKIGTVLQDSMSALNPVICVEEQMIEFVTTSKLMKKSEAISRVSAFMADLGIKNIKRVLKSYPHQLSGGECQRICIAMACLPSPELLIMDEPTTALDLITQEELIQSIHSIKKNMGFSLIFVTHDFGVVKKIAEFIAVMKQGEIVESGPTSSILSRPQHLYTQRLISAIPVMGTGKQKIEVLDLHA